MDLFPKIDLKLTPDERDILVKARAILIAGFAERRCGFLCTSIESASSRYCSVLLYKIKGAIKGQYTLNDWILLKGGHCPDDEGMQAARLAWIDWLLAQ